MIFGQPCKVQKAQAAASGKGFVNVLRSLLGGSHDLDLQLKLTQWLGIGLDHSKFRVDAVESE